VVRTTGPRAGKTRWLWSDDERRDTLVAEYNRRFNSLRAPVYDGSHLRLPGLSDHFTPHSYQRNAVARITNEPSTLLDHVVGAGKTGTMLMAAMELRRLGLVRQPWIVVPNHIIEQVGREAKQWYPAANVLLGSSATTAEGRRRFIAQSAASEWDMAIVPQSAFTAINVSNDVRVAYAEKQLDDLRTQLESATVERSQKAIMRAIKTAQARLEKLMAAETKDVVCVSRNRAVTTCSSTKRTCTRTSSACATSRSCPVRPQRNAPKTSASNSTSCASVATTRRGPAASPNTPSSNASPPSPPAHRSPTPSASCG
jgi:N12 class adenine-specific DNA methylase